MSNNFTFIRGGNSTNSGNFDNSNTTAIALLICIGLFVVWSCCCLCISNIKLKKIKPDGS